MFSPKKILVPTDYSEFSDNALKQALDIAKQHKAKIYLFHVVGLIQQCAVDYCLDNAMLMELDKKSVKSAKDLKTQRMKSTIDILKLLNLNKIQKPIRRLKEISREWRWVGFPPRLGRK